MNSDYESTEDVELTEDHLAFFREAGASEVFLTLIDADPEEVGGFHNSVRKEAKRYVYYGDLDGNPEEFTHDGSIFFAKMWDGDLYEAYRHYADFASGPLLRSVFGEERINTAKPDPESPEVSEIDPDRYFI